MSQKKKATQQTGIASEASSVKSIFTFDWSILNGIIIGLVVACLMFFIFPYTMPYAPFWGAVVAGSISRKNGWIAGTLLGLVIFVAAAYFTSRWWPEYIRLFKSSPYFHDSSLSHAIGRMMFIVPACAVGGFLGEVLRQLIMKIAQK